MLEFKKYIESERNRVSARVYLELQDFVLGCSYTRYKDAKMYVTLRLSGISYPEIARRMSIKEGTIRWRDSSDISEHLYEIFGTDFFTLLYDYSNNQEEVNKRIFNAISVVGNRNTLVPFSICEYVSRNLIGVEDLSSYTLMDCSKEIKFLEKYSESAILNDLATVSSEKLEYLLRVIDGTSGTKDDRCFLFSILKDQKEEM